MELRSPRSYVGGDSLDDWDGGQGHTLFHRAVADLGYIGEQHVRAVTLAKFEQAAFGLVSLLRGQHGPARGQSPLPVLLQLVHRILYLLADDPLQGVLRDARLQTLEHDPLAAGQGRLEEDRHPQFVMGEVRGWCSY